MANRFWEKFNQGLETGTRIWDADSKRRMQQELIAANKMAPEQSTVGVAAPQAGQVPTGYEDYIQARPEGGFMARSAEGLTPEQVQQRSVIAERFSAPTAFTTPQTSYSLGGVTRDTAFAPEDIAQARMQKKAEIYSNYGREDLAEQMQTNALARQAAALNIKKLQTEVDDQAAFRKDIQSATDMMRSAADVAAESKRLLDSGDREGAARLVVDWRSKNVPDSKLMRVNDNGILEGSRDGGKTWVQAASDVGNVYNPQVVENLLSGVASSADEHLNRIMFKHARTPEALASMINATKDLAMKEKQFGEGVRQFDKTFGLKQDELKTTTDYYNARIGLMRDELKQKGLLIPSEIAKNFSAASSNNTANEINSFNLQQLKGFANEKNKIIDDLDSGKIDKNTAQQRLNMAAFKFGGKLTESKEMTTTQYKDLMEVVANKTAGFEKLAPEVQNELVQREWNTMQGIQGGSSAGGLDYNSVVMNDKGTPAKPAAATPARGLTASVSAADFDTMLADAKRGGMTGKNYLQNMISNNMLSYGQRVQAETALGLR